MAPLPIIENAVRVGINWSASAGIRPVNVFHLITDSQSEVAIGAALDSAFDAPAGNPFSIVMANFQIESWAITLLSSSSATQIVPCTETITGSGGGNMIPQVAGVLSMRTSERGSRGRGRLFLGPVGEADADAGLMSSGIPAGTVAAWNTVADELAADPLNISFGVASYVHQEIAGVQTFSMRRAFGTQRRRQNQVV